MPDIDDPFQPPPDPTVIRPQPGGGRGRRSAGDGGVPRPALASAPPRAEPIPESLRDDLGAGLNPLVRCASPLLILAGQLRTSRAGTDVDGLRRHVRTELRHFEERAQASNITNEVIHRARYALCAAIDEAVLSTPWGAQSAWSEQTLLVALYRETWGGEKFFDLLDRLSRDPERNLDLMELQYYCLAFGFAGKYQVSERGHSQLDRVTQDLYHRIRSLRAAPPSELSERWQGAQDRRHRLVRYVPWWVVAAASLVLLTLTYIWYYQRLAQPAEQVEVALSKVGRATAVRAAVPAPPHESLKVLLGPQERAGLLEVEESNGLTKVILASPTLFASGSATVDTAYEATLLAVADALNKVPGRVLVVGHTDDQPLRSFRYRNNVELSAARADAIAAVLRAHLDNPNRLETTGVGSDELRDPRPEYRARNRRVELIHGT